jgi:hypothetical protein
MKYSYVNYKLSIYKNVEVEGNDKRRGRTEIG